MKMSVAIHDEKGESLLELLVTISIISIGIIALVAGLLTAVTASSAHREQADAGAIARNIAESIKDNTVALAPNGGDYGSAWSDVDHSGASVDVHTDCWNGDLVAGWTSCPQDTGLQRIQIEVTSRGADEKVTILKRETVA
jgi:Tfp pilus assembly protein PilV